MNFLITGAGRGIGLELTQFALEAGHTVYAIVRDPNGARTLNHTQKSYTKHLHILKADVTSRAELLHAHQHIEGVTIDILINNAGILTQSDEEFSEVNEDHLQKTFAVNTIAPVIVTQVFLNNLKKSKMAKLINITSLMGSIDDNSSGSSYAYRMSKAALNMFTKNFSVDFPHITALTLHPGWVRTEMGGAQAPLLPREAARGLFQVIINATNGQTGQFFDYSGKRLKW